MEREWYFVSMVPPEERPPDGGVFEIQVLNDAGEGIEWGYIRPEDKSLTIGDRLIPETVLAAAKRCAIGHGQYVDRNGNIVRPF